MTYLIDFECLNRSKSRSIRSVNFLNFEFRLSWRLQLRCLRRLASSSQILFFFRLGHQNVSLVICHMKLLRLESFLLSFDVPFFLLMRQVILSCKRLRFPNIIQNRWMLTLKHVLECENWSRLSRYIATKINIFLLDKCFKSCLICVMFNLIVGQPHLEYIFFFILNDISIFQIKADLAEKLFDKMLRPSSPLFLNFLSYSYFLRT